MLTALLPQSERKLAPLYDYQSQARSDIFGEWNKGFRKTLCVIPTGGGKTRVAGSVIYELAQDNLRTLFLAHRRKLVRQAALAISCDWGLETTLQMGDTGHDIDMASVVCGTVQTVSASLPPSKTYELVVIDEGHRVHAPQYQKVLNHFSKSKVLLLTATPARSDHKAILGPGGADSKACDIPLSQLIEEGYLAPLTILNIPVEIKLEKTRGDFNETEIAHSIEPYLASCADAFVEHAKDRCSLVFLPLIKTSKLFVSLLKERGITAAHVDGEMEEGEIESHIRDLEAGKIQAVCCSMLLTEGVDIKPVNCIMNLRPTKSWVLYTQIVGRGTRIYDPESYGGGWPKKTDCLLLDPLWLCEQHSLLQRPASLFASSEQEAEEIDKALRQGGGGKKDILNAVKKARSNHEDALRDRLEEVSKKDKRMVNAMDLFLKMGRSDLVEYEPVATWETDPVTVYQEEAIRKAGINIESVKNKGHASAIIGMLTHRVRGDLASVKQARFANVLGMKNAFTAPTSDVKRFIAQRINKR